LDRNGPRLLICLSGSHTTSHALRASGTQRRIAPSPLAGEGGVRGSLGESKPIEGLRLAERNPSPGSHLAMRSGLFHKGRGGSLPRLLSGTHRPIAPSPLAGEGGVRGSLGESKPIEGIATRGEKPLTRIASCDALRPLPQGERRGFAATRVRDAPADRSLSPCG